MRKLLLITLIIPFYSNALDYMTGNQLFTLGHSYKQSMANNSKGNTFESGMYMGYVAGAIGPTSAVEMYCAPDRMTLGQASDVIYKYLDANPEKRDMQANFLVATALIEAFPCKKDDAKK